MSKINELRERVKTFMTTKNFTIYKLCDGDTVLHNKVSRQLAGTNVTFEVLDLLLTKFPDLSAEWLLRGTGNMLLSEREQPGTINNTQNGGSNNTINNNRSAGIEELLAERTALLAERDARIAEKDARITDLQNMIDLMGQIIKNK